MSKYIGKLCKCILDSGRGTIIQVHLVLIHLLYKNVEKLQRTQSHE